MNPQNFSKTSQFNNYPRRVLWSEWSQVIALIIALVGVTAWLDGKHREDMRYHREDMLKVTQNIERMETHHREDMAKNEAHWREMFTYMSSRIDNIKENSSQTIRGRS